MNAACTECSWRGADVSTAEQVVRSLSAHVGNMHHGLLYHQRPVVLLVKDDAPCCLATRDDHGRMTPGFCSEACLRRPRGGGS